MLLWCAAFADAVAGQQAPATRASAPVQPSAEDAAPAYRRLVAALRERFGPDVALPEGEAHDAALGLTTPTAVRADWRAAVAAAEPELAAWHAVATLRGCRFARTSAEPMLTEYMHALFLPLQQLQALNVAAALPSRTAARIGWSAPARARWHWRDTCGGSPAPPPGKWPRDWRRRWWNSWSGRRRSATRR